MSGDFTGHDMAQAREDGYDRGVQLATEYERILSDLLEEVAGCHYSCECINCHWARLAADRAEARLREVQGE